MGATWPLLARWPLVLTATTDDGRVTRFKALVRIDTPQELQYYKHGGILEYVLRQLAK